jgi:hypothetical protein
MQKTVVGTIAIDETDCNPIIKQDNNSITDMDTILSPFDGKHVEILITEL